MKFEEQSPRPTWPPALAEVVADAEHRLRNVLNEIRGFEQLLGLSEHLVEEDARAVAHVHSATEELDAALETIFTLARVGCGRYVVEPLAVPVSHMVATVRHAAPAAEVSVDERIEGWVVSTDPVAFEHAVREAARSGRALTVRFAADEGRLRVELAETVGAPGERSEPLSEALTRAIAGALGATPQDAPGLGWLLTLVRLPDDGVT